MGMSTHVSGFKPPDEKWQRMKDIWDACEAAGIAPPEEVIEFFEGEPPDPAGVEVPEEDLIGAGCATKWKDTYRQGFEVNITKIPKDVTLIRFYNAW